MCPNARLKMWMHLPDHFMVKSVLLSYIVVCYILYQHMNDVIGQTAGKSFHCCRHMVWCELEMQTFKHLNDKYRWNV